MSEHDVILIAYTTRYRDGGARIRQVATTMARERARARPDAELRCVATEDKRALVDELGDLAARGGRIAELHFVGHSGMYGPMFGTTSLPEQFSPHEWRTLEIPFAPDGEAFFHACRTARWFAPFFARTFGVPAHGYHWYTAFSRRPDRFAYMHALCPPHAPLYLFGCPGKKSHGLLGSLGKFTGLMTPEPIKRFEPTDLAEDTGYDPVAEMYDEVFEDIRVRRDEWRWIQEHWPAEPARALDIGCGNGALLRALGERVAQGVGVDASRRMIEISREHADEEGLGHLEFVHIDGPDLPFDDAAFDVVVSFLSFRYLDWDPIMHEIVRVLRPGGRLLVVDMVTSPPSLEEAPRLARAKLEEWWRRATDADYRRALERMVHDARWRTMLEHNPIRAEHELTWYLESRFPGRHVELLNVGVTNRMLAFDSGPIHDDYIAPQSYP